jgi:hypothetical protein
LGADPGGILSIIAGAFHLIGWLAIGPAVSLFHFESGGYFGPGRVNFPQILLWVFLIPLMLMAIMAIIGGVFALLRRYWGLALAGAI